MGKYRPRPSESRICLHCASSFSTKHKRAQYCGASCRQLAYQARRKTQSPPAPAQVPARELSFSVKNVGVAAAGAGVVALTNYVINDRPVQQAVLAQLHQLTQRVDQLTQALQASGVAVPGDPAPFSSPAAKWSLPPTIESMTLDDLADLAALQNRQRS